MKKSELDIVMNNLKEIKEFSDKLDYNSSSYINQKMININPILDKELSRLDGDVEINCPQIITAIVQANTCDEWINGNIKSLLLQEYKIIDYGIKLGTTDDFMVAYIKYTN